MCKERYLFPQSSDFPIFILCWTTIPQYAILANSLSRMTGRAGGDEALHLATPPPPPPGPGLLYTVLTPHRSRSGPTPPPPLTVPGPAPLHPPHHSGSSPGPLYALLTHCSTSTSLPPCLMPPPLCQLFWEALGLGGGGHCHHDPSILPSGREA